MSVNLVSVCGLFCGDCEYFKKQCQGCGFQKGKPFWTSQMEIECCPLFDCCINKKKIEHCGLCDELPCETFKNFYDPSLSPEEAEESVLTRENELIQRKNIGTEKWVQQKNSRDKQS